MNKTKALEITRILTTLYPDATCFLNHRNAFELICAVMLSAQTTDARVNMVTPDLFAKYPDANSLAMADFQDVKEIIKSIGLAQTKAKNLISLAKMLVQDFAGQVPDNMNDLKKLPGVGQKTANVILAVWFNIPAIPVDTHVYRVSYRLGFRKEKDDVLTCEEKLRKYLAKEDWILMHHAIILFGRNICKAQNPNCAICPLKEYCQVKLWK